MTTYYDDLVLLQISVNTKYWPLSNPNRLVQIRQIEKCTTTDGSQTKNTLSPTEMKSIQTNIGKLKGKIKEINYILPRYFKRFLIPR